MSFNRIFVPSAALALIVSLSACHSNNSQPASNQPPASQNPQVAQNQEQASSPAAGQPSRQPGTQSGSAAARVPAPPPPPPPPAVISLPSGTALRIRLDQDLGSKISQPGDSFSASVADDVLVNGQTVIPRGARADGTVVDAKPLGRFKGGALLSVRLDRVHTRWGSYPVSTGAIDRVEQGKGKRSAGFIGGGAGLGALIGGLAGGGKGALIGGLVGGGAGTAGGAFTGNKQIVLPAETLLTFRLEHPVHITEEHLEQSDPGRQQLPQ